MASVVAPFRPNHHFMYFEVTTDYSLRAASSSDIPFLVDLRVITMGTTILKHQPWIAAEQIARVHYRFDCARVITLRAQDIGLWKVASDSSMTELIQVQLLPEFQGLGIGTHLIRRLQEECRLAMRPIKLHVFASNPALKLYERLGFRVADQDEHSFQLLWQPPLVSAGRDHGLADEGEANE
jgi:GNAT superfamily N-acetyltransferase